MVTAKRVHRALSKESQRGRFDTRNPRRGFIGHFTNLHGATARALGRAGSLQRFHRIRTAPQRGRFDTRNPRRGFIGHFTNLHGATARALGRTGSLQRVHRAVLKFARRHSEGAVARAILAEGSSDALQIRTAPQWERFEARDPCRGFIGHSTNTRNVENDRRLTKSRMNTPHTANIDAGSCIYIYIYVYVFPRHVRFRGRPLRFHPGSLRFGFRDTDRSQFETGTSSGALDSKNAIRQRPWGAKPGEGQQGAVLGAEA